MIVTPKSIPVRHNGRRYATGEEFEIDRSGYERIAEHLEVISEDKPIEKMTVSELMVYAEQHNIDLGEATKKTEILAVIMAAQQDVSDQNGGAADDDQ